MKKFFVISNFVLFLVLAALTYFLYFSPLACLISFACFLLAVINSGATKSKILIAVYILEAVACIFIFLANGPFAYDWLMGGINLLQIALVWFGQIIFLMFVLGLTMRKQDSIEKRLASKV